MEGPLGPHLGFLFLGGIAMLLFWGGVAVLIVWAARAFSRPPGPQLTPPAGPVAPSVGTPRQLLDERLVKGEISVEEYEKIKAALEG
jgi:uncharacterized membrane protein